MAILHAKTNPRSQERRTRRLLLRSLRRRTVGWEQMACFQSEEDARQSWMQWCIEHVQAALAPADANQGDWMRRREIAQEICDDAWVSAAYRRRLAMLKHLQQAVRAAAHQLNNHTLEQKERTTCSQRRGLP